jgi:phosphoribosyl 1,2-cyclic phosphate phosphodiesterase
MKITFLGTSGANAYPEAFCNCPNCEQARKEGGRSLRKRSSLLVNDDLLIDLGPDIMPAAQIHGAPLTNVRYCIQTHPHADHLDVSHFISRSPILGVKNAPRLHFYASEETLTFANEAFIHNVWDKGLLTAEQQEVLNCKCLPLLLYHPEKIGNYTVTAFRANHAPGLGAYLYAIETDNHTIFYGSDTGVFFEETWQKMHEMNLQYDVVILEHTMGLKAKSDFHLNAQQVVAHINRMKSEGLMKENTLAYATHIAHDANPSYSELVQYASQFGYKIAYDGLRLEL